VHTGKSDTRCARVVRAACAGVQAQAVLLERGAVPLVVRWLAAGPEQEVATAAARALAKAAKGHRGIQTAIIDASAPRARSHISKVLSRSPGQVSSSLDCRWMTHQG
jgi:hypothetical protein